MNYLHVSEKFISIQGEGATMGSPSLFLRLGGCNLLCKSDSWVCDTIEVWRKSNKVEFKDVLDEDEVDFLRKSKSHLIITGGEPMLQQSRIISYLKWFEDWWGWLPTIEIETNGTIQPTAWLYRTVSHWNVSPKLEDSGELKRKRRVSKVIRFFSRRTNKKVIFKRKPRISGS